MRAIQVSQLSLNEEHKINTVSLLLDNIDKNTIDTVPWAEFPYKPDVSFAISYSDNSILIKYYVKEKAIAAVYNKTNSPVFKDSCVEFFIAFNGDENYYNLEFNCVGTCLAAFGKNRDDRQLLPVKTINKIKHLSDIKSGYSADDSNIYWELTLMIPYEVFCHHNIKQLKGLDCRANFYKCGDDLPEPHFLCWNPIQSPEPDFHLSSYFGEVHFR